jgi:hypothetical protein
MRNFLFAGSLKSFNGPLSILKPFFHSLSTISTYYQQTTDNNPAYKMHSNYAEDMCERMNAIPKK